MMEMPYIIGVMGGGSATESDLETAYISGAMIAKQGWILLNGGRAAGIMDASAKGAAENGGITLGILPGSDDRQVSDYIMIPILTGMGNARNAVNVLSSNVVVAFPGGAGTVSEIALALKAEKNVVLMNFSNHKDSIFSLFKPFVDKGFLHNVQTPDQMIDKIKILLGIPSD